MYSVNEQSYLDEYHNDDEKSKKRGNYKCGKCGKPKKGHTCTEISSTNKYRFENMSPQYLTRQQYDLSDSHYLEKIDLLLAENAKLKAIIAKLEDDKNYYSNKSYSSDNSESDYYTDEQSEEYMVQNDFHSGGARNQYAYYFNSMNNHAEHFLQYKDEISGSPSCTNLQDRMYNQHNNTTNVEEFYHHDNTSYCC